MFKIAKMWYIMSLIITAPANLIGMLLYNKKKVSSGETTLKSVLIAIIIATILPLLNIFIAASNILYTLSGDSRDDETK